MIVVVPTLLSLLAFLLKLRFPIRTKEQNEVIAEGIGLHILGKSAHCPISDTDYSFVHMTKTEQRKAYMLDYFSGLENAVKYLADPLNRARKLVYLSQKQLVIAIICLCLAAGMVGGTYHFLTEDDFVVACGTGSNSSLNNSEWDYENPDAFCGISQPDGTSSDLSFLPVIGIVFFGVSVTAIGFTYLRLKGAHKLAADEVESTTVQKIILQRRQLAQVSDFDTSICEGFRTLRTDSPSRKRKMKTSSSLEMTGYSGKDAKPQFAQVTGYDDAYGSL